MEHPRGQKVLKPTVFKSSPSLSIVEGEVDAPDLKVGIVERQPATDRDAKRTGGNVSPATVTKCEAKTSTNKRSSTEQDQASPTRKGASYERHLVVEDDEADAFFEEFKEAEPVIPASKWESVISDQTEALARFEASVIEVGNVFANSINGREPNAKDKFAFIKKNDSLPDMLRAATRASGALFDMTELAGECNLAEAEGVLADSIIESESAILAQGFSSFLQNVQRQLQADGKVMLPEEIRRRFADCKLVDKAMQAAVGANRFLPEEVTSSPNMGAKNNYFSEEMAPRALIAEHAKKIVRSGRGFLTSKRFASAVIGRLHSTSCLIAEKPAPPTMSFAEAQALPPTKKTRFCTHGSDKRAGATNDRRQIARIVGATTKIESDQLQDICQLAINATRVWPGRSIYGVVSDVEAAYNRCLASEETVRFTPIDIKVGDEDCLLFLPCCWFGYNDSGFWWETAKACLLENTHKRVRAFILADDSADKALAEEMQVFGMYVDDRYGFGPLDFASQEQSNFRTEAGAEHDGALGRNATSEAKEQCSQQMAAIGYAFDLELMRVEMLEKTFAKILILVFLEIPLTTTSGEGVNIKRIQKLMSLTFRLAALVPYAHFLASPYCSMVRQETSTHNKNVYWSDNAVTSLMVTRQFMLLACKYPSMRSVPIWVPAYISRHRLETKEERSARILHHADIVLHVDASGSEQLLGAWMARAPPDWPATSFCIDSLHIDGFHSQNVVEGKPKPYHINVLELLASVVAIMALVAFANESGKSLQGVRVHILTDNTASEAQVAKMRSESIISRFLLQILFHLQIEAGMVLTVGRISTLENKYADALSRAFCEAWMAAIKNELSSVPRLKVPADVKRAFADVSRDSSATASCMTRHSLTVASSVKQLSFGAN